MKCSRHLNKPIRETACSASFMLDIRDETCSCSEDFEEVRLCADEYSVHVESREVSDSDRHAPRVPCSCILTGRTARFEDVRPTALG